MRKWHQKLEKTYVVKNADATKELGRYTTVDGAKAAMKRRGIDRKDYRLFQIKFR